MDKSQCLVADWHTIGYEDGSSGKAESNIREYRKDCARHQVVPNLEQYRTGHYAGSEQFCRERNGYALGKKGYVYQRSCPHDLEDGFLAGYQDGQQIHSLKKIVHSYYNQITRAEREVSNVNQLIIDKNELIIADGLVRQQRLAIRDELIALQDNIIQLEQTLVALEEHALRADKKYKRSLELSDNKSRWS